MWYRVWRWVIWTVLGSLLPFAGLMLMRALDVQRWPDLTTMFGSGQLLLTCVALTAGGLKELSGMDKGLRDKVRDTAFASLIGFGLVVAMVYGYMANLLIRNTVLSTEQQQLVSTISLIAFGFALIAVGGSVAISSPDERLFPKRGQKRDTKD